MCRCVLRGPSGASDGETEDGSQEARGGWRLCRWRAGRRPAAVAAASTFCLHCGVQTFALLSPRGHHKTKTLYTLSTLKNIKTLFFMGIWLSLWVGHLYLYQMLETDDFLKVNIYTYPEECLYTWSEVSQSGSTWTVFFWLRTPAQFKMSENKHNEVKVLTSNFHLNVFTFISDVEIIDLFWTNRSSRG